MTLEMSPPTALARQWTEVRRAATCAECGTSLAVGTSAWRDAERRALICSWCAEPPLDDEGEESAPLADWTAPARWADEDAAIDDDDDEVDDEVESEDEAEDEDASIDDAVLEDDSTAAEEPVAAPQPAPGPRLRARPLPAQRLHAMLERLEEHGVLALHDRSLPDGTTVGHLIVAPGGAWVVATKQFAGRIDLDVDGEPGPTHRLLVNGDDTSSVLASLEEQAAQVRQILASAGAEEVEVRTVLCLDSQLAPGQGPLEVRGHLVAWPGTVRQHLVEHGPLEADDRIALTRYFARTLPAAS